MSSYLCATDLEPEYPCMETNRIRCFGSISSLLIVFLQVSTSFSYPFHDTPTATICEGCQTRPNQQARSSKSSLAYGIPSSTISGRNFETTEVPRIQTLDPRGWHMPWNEWSNSHDSGYQSPQDGQTTHRHGPFDDWNGATGPWPHLQSEWTLGGWQNAWSQTGQATSTLTVTLIMAKGSGSTTQTSSAISSSASEVPVVTNSINTNDAEMLDQSTSSLSIVTAVITSTPARTRTTRTKSENTNVFTASNSTWSSSMKMAQESTASGSNVTRIPVTSIHTALAKSSISLPHPTSFSKTELSIISSLSFLFDTSTSTIASIEPSSTTNVNKNLLGNIFQPIAIDPPPAQISQRGDHIIPRTGIQPQTDRLQTNKFYANFYLGSQSQPSWTHPYSVRWIKGAGPSHSWGIAVSHVERNQLMTAPAQTHKDAGQWSYLINPIDNSSLILSADELGNATTLTTDSLQAFSVNVNLATDGNSDPLITFPLIQGMAFVTARYSGGIPLVQTSIGFSSFTNVGAVSGGNTTKYRVVLHDGFEWLIYVTATGANYNTSGLIMVNSGIIKGPVGFFGHIQVSKIPSHLPHAESVYDASAGAYPVGLNLTGSVQGASGTYTFSWNKQGVTNKPLLIYALPHHLESFSSETAGSLTDLELVTTTKGLSKAVLADSWTLIEPNLPNDMSFAPWSSSKGNIPALTPSAQKAVNAAAAAELTENISAQTNVGSLYYDGKAFAKFATIIYTAHDLGGDTSLAMTHLNQLESAFDTHIQNKMQIPLVYDSAWGGIVSSSTYQSGNVGDDFGNTIYNDHHFHYGYYVYTAAVIAHLDPSWLQRGTNHAWVNMLVRDYANPTPSDPYFPSSRMFDWFHGHSWAHGILEAVDGKDQESSSEDSLALYALKMWGRVTADPALEARSNLMLALQARALRHYYLYQPDNPVQPAPFLGNKAAGILFENKIDHTTYFGAEPEFIQGIHMLPIMPCSAWTRSTAFVRQEWDAYFASDGLQPVEDVTDGWRGVLMANYALIDPKASYDFFSNVSGTFLRESMLDGGASQTWYLAWAAALGGG